MHAIRLTLLILSVLCFSHYAKSQDIVLYGTAGVGTCDTQPALERSLYVVNPNTGQMQLVGTPGFDGMTALASLDDGRLVAVGIQNDNSSILVEINPLTGQGTLIGVIGNNNNPGECSRVPGLTYDSATDTLYGLARSCNGITAPLVTINPDTAEMTTIGPTGLGGGGFGLAIRGDGTLFASTWNGFNFSLFTLDRNTGASALIGTMDTSGISPGPLGIGGLAFNPITQQLYAAANNGDFGTDSYLLTVDESVPPSFNVVGQTVDCFDGIAFAERISTDVPTLSEWGLITMAAVLGVIGILAVRRKRLAA